MDSNHRQALASVRLFLIQAKEHTSLRHLCPSVYFLQVLRKSRSQSLMLATEGTNQSANPSGLWIIEAESCRQRPSSMTFATS